MNPLVLSRLARHAPRTNVTLQNRFRLYHVTGLGAVVGTGELPGVEDSLTCAPADFSFGAFTDAASPCEYLLDAVLRGTPIEVDEIPGFVEAQSLERWKWQAPPPLSAGTVFRPFDFEPAETFVAAFGCTHAQSSYQRMRAMSATGTYADDRGFSHENLPSAREYPYEFVRYAIVPEVFDKGCPVERGLIVGAGGDVGCRPNTRMVCEWEIVLCCARRSSATRPPRIIGWTASNEVTDDGLEKRCLAYLRQAKAFFGCSILGPALAVSPEPMDLTADNCNPRNGRVFLPPETWIRGTLFGPDGQTKFTGTVTLADLQRPVQFYPPWAMRNRGYRYWFLHMGTGMPLPDDVDLLPGDRVMVETEQGGTLLHGAVALETSFLDDFATQKM